jgi:gluconate 2-dehydrogenase gamma chain
MERRDLFKIMAAGAAAAPVLAQPRQAAFTQAQLAVLDRVSDIIIPSDEQSPGAHEAGVVQYVDLAASLNAQRRQVWTRGIEAVEALAHQKHSRGFMECPRDEQEQMVEQMAKNEGQPTNDLERFFTTLKPIVIDGYRYSEVGVKQYMRWEGNHYEVSAWKGACDHPEHLS